MDQQSIKDEVTQLQTLLQRLDGKASLIIAGAAVYATLNPKVPEALEWPLSIALFLSLVLSIACIWPSSATSANAASWPNIVSYRSEDEAVEAIRDSIDTNQHYAGQLYFLAKMAHFKTNALRISLIIFSFCIAIAIIYH